MSVDRLAPGYEPRFDRDFAYGRQAELYIGDVAEALKMGAAYEVKCDAVSVRTGNLYIEDECLRRGRWCPSGIAATTAELACFVIGTTGLALVVGMQTLKDVAARHGTRHEQARGSHPTRGVTVPIEKLVREVRRAAA
jgi:hypothetical protein